MPSTLPIDAIENIFSVLCLLKKRLDAISPETNTVELENIMDALTDTVHEMKSEVDSLHASLPHLHLWRNNNIIERRRTESDVGF